MGWWSGPVHERVEELELQRLHADYLARPDAHPDTYDLPQSGFLHSLVDSLLSVVVTTLIAGISLGTCVAGFVLIFAGTRPALIALAGALAILSVPTSLIATHRIDLGRARQPRLVLYTLIILAGAAVLAWLVFLILHYAPQIPWPDDSQVAPVY